MTDMETDEATGLPELPEGQYWKFEYYGGVWSGRIFEPVVPPGYRLHVMEGARRSPGGLTGNPPTACRCTPQPSSEVELRFVPGRRNLIGIRQSKTEYRYLYETTESVEVDSRTVEPSGDIYPISTDIELAAFDLMRDRNERDEAGKLLGCYPPGQTRGCLMRNPKPELHFRNPDERIIGGFKAPERLRR